jgi:hypothetical protein
MMFTFHLGSLDQGVALRFESAEFNDVLPYKLATNC